MALRDNATNVNLLSYLVQLSRYSTCKLKIKFAIKSNMAPKFYFLQGFWHKKEKYHRR